MFARRNQVILLISSRLTICNWC